MAAHLIRIQLRYSGAFIKNSRCSLSTGKALLSIAHDSRLAISVHGFGVARSQVIGSRIGDSDHLCKVSAQDVRERSGIVGK